MRSPERAPSPAATDPRAQPAPRATDATWRGAAPPPLPRPGPLGWALAAVVGSLAGLIIYTVGELLV